MSAGGPDSIPTSADRRSKRPTKRRLLSPTSDQAASVDALFSKPEQHIHIPDSATPQARALPPPPEIVTNVQGSSAGAGSGEFHVYKAARRREYERLRRMDDEVRNEDANRDFETKKAERQKVDDEKTRKNREKREKMKARKAKAKTGGAGSQSKQDKPGSGNQQQKKPSFPKRDDAGANANDDDSTTTAAPSGVQSPSQPQVEGTKVATPDATSTSAATPPAGIMIHDDDD
ncbi:hypothetical protein BROUX41_003062 [Berkeleyomyces rouxiae]|uniref:uncharacterized protein n=1 Tax=Berkeleyomyces rouxiae TaxID=2035830 RepID=UPI003B7AC86B